MKISTIAFILILLINFYFLICVRLQGNNNTNWKTVIYSDGNGYYAYLNSIFITKEFAKQDAAQNYVNDTSSRPPIKYFAGTAIAFSPFFAAGYLYALFRGENDNGYSFPFQMMIAFAGFTYLGAGLFFLNKLMDVFGVNEVAKAAVLILITYGTNLFYYGILEPSMSHVYSFSTITIFIYAAYWYFRKFNLANLIVASVALGLTILIRPANGVIICMLPFLIGNWNKLRNFFLRYSHIFLIMVIAGMFILIQMVCWHLQSGEWYIWSYAGEGFYFSRPAIINVLLSWNKGLFIYTPLTFISCLGIIRLYKLNRQAFYSIIITLSMALYVTAAWWCWNYGDSFGMRPMIDFYSLFGILLGVFLSGRKITARLAAMPMAFLLILSVVQTYQYYNRIMHRYNMDKEKYWYIFFKTNDRYKNVLAGNVDLPGYSQQSPVLIYSTKNDFQDQYAGWFAPNISDDPIHSGEKSCLFNDSGGALNFTLDADSILKPGDLLYVKASLRRFEFAEHSSSAATLHASIESEKGHLFDYEFRINDLPDQNVGQWKFFNYAFNIPVPKEQFQTLTIQILNPERQRFLIDDFEITVYRLFPQSLM